MENNLRVFKPRKFGMRYERFREGDKYVTVVPLQVAIETDNEITDSRARILVLRLVLKSGVQFWIDELKSIVNHDFRFVGGVWFKNAADRVSRPRSSRDTSRLAERTDGQV